MKPSRLNTVALLLSLTLVATSMTAIAVVAAREKNLENKIPSHIPISVKVSNLNNPDWARDLEIEVKNTGDKPIYYLKLILLFEDVKSEDEVNPIGYPLAYGRHEMLNVSNKAQPEDVPIAPGEKYTFRLSQRQSDGWKAGKAKLTRQDPQRLLLLFHNLNFGDGTGYFSTGGVRVPRRISSQGTLNSSPLTKSDEFNPINFSFLKTGGFAFSQQADSVLPKTAFAIRGNEKLMTRCDTCCPGTNGQCSAMQEYPGAFQCLCGRASEARTVPCSDSQGVCGKQFLYMESCYDEFGYQVFCPNFFVNPCDSWDGI